MHPDASPTTTLDAAARNRAVVQDAWEALTDDRWDALERCFAPDYRRHTARGSYDREQLRASLEASHRAFEPQSYTLSEFVADAERTAFRWELTAIHRGAYLGVPPTQRLVTVSGLTISRLEDGLIKEDWASWNRLGVLEALGIVPIGTL